MRTTWTWLETGGLAGCLDSRCGNKNKNILLNNDLSLKEVSSFFIKCAVDSWVRLTMA